MTLKLNNIEIMDVLVNNISITEVYMNGVVVFSQSFGPTFPVAQQQKLQASDKEAEALFGRALAIDDDTCTIAASYDDAGALNTGAAYVFTRSGGVWTQQQKLVGPDSQVGDLFSYSMSIDNDRCIIGAFNEDTLGQDAGAVYIFIKSGNVWQDTQKVQALDTEDYDNFGYSVALDNATYIVGANQEDSLGVSAGAAYIFE